MQKNQQPAQIYGASEQLVDVGSAMRGCSSEGPAAVVLFGSSRAELARRGQGALHGPAALSECWVCVLCPHQHPTTVALCANLSLVLKSI